MKSALSYGDECWTFRVKDENKLKTTKIRMLRMICGKTLKHKINTAKIL